MKVLVTGGTGFLGRHMVAALLGKGCNVTVLARRPDKVDILPHPNLTIRKGDITDPNSIFGVTRNIEVVYHFAAQLGKWGLPDDLFYSVNVNGTENLLRECRHTPNLRFVFISTPGVQGKGHKAAAESLPYNPPYIYERTKCAAEKRVLSYQKKNDMPVVVIRPDFVYGPLDYRRISLYRTIKKRRFLCIGDRRVHLHPTYVDDTIQGLILAGFHPAAPGEIFNIAGPETVSVRDYLHTIALELGVAIPRFSIPKIIGLEAAFIFENVSKFLHRPPFISRSKVEFLTLDHGSDISKARQVLGYTPKYSFADGFRLTRKWADKNNLL